MQESTRYTLGVRRVVFADTCDLLGPICNLLQLLNGKEIQFLSFMAGEGSIIAPKLGAPLKTPGHDWCRLRSRCMHSLLPMSYRVTCDMLCMRTDRANQNTCTHALSKTFSNPWLSQALADCSNRGTHASEHNQAMTIFFGPKWQACSHQLV